VKDNISGLLLQSTKLVL